MTDALNRALDRFDVPPLSTGLAERIAAAVASPTSAPFAAPRRDRRGMWRRGRQVVLGTLAVGMLSAGAVASGFLGRVGIEVPVLTAMLAPKPKPVAKPVPVAPQPALTRTAVVPPPPIIVDTAQAEAARPLLPAERFALREERRERRQAFAAEHPVAAAAIRDRVRQELQRRAQARRQALMVPGIDPSIPGARALDFADQAMLVRAARRDRLIAEKMIDRRIQANEARRAARQGATDSGVFGPPAALVPSPLSVTPEVGSGQLRPLGNRAQQLSPEDRAVRRARIEQMTPEQRTQWRDTMQQRRAMRLERQRLDAARNQDSNDSREGNPPPPR